jgi:hypothetical protein
VLLLVVVMMVLLVVVVLFKLVVLIMVMQLEGLGLMVLNFWRMLYVLERMREWMIRLQRAALRLKDRINHRGEMG